MEIGMELAAISIAVSTAYPETVARYEKYRSAAPAQFSIAITPENIEEERITTEKMAQAYPGVAYSFAPEALDDQAVYHQIAERLPEYSALLFHGSAVAVNGGGYLFAGASGAGKSTHARLWRQLWGERAVMINDDHPILRCGKNHIWVCGSPWNGKHNLGSRLMVPLKAVCFIKQSPANRLIPLDDRAAYPPLLQQCYPCRESGHAVRTLEIAEKIARHVPMYQLECNMDLSAARVAWEGIHG